jgi:hypothetical protein
MVMLSARTVPMQLKTKELARVIYQIKFVIRCLSSKNRII